MDAQRQEKLNKFHASRQEPVRLAIALEEFFRSELSDAAREVYGVYLRRRLRPALAALIDQENVAYLEQLYQLGWLTLPQVEDALSHARRERRTASLIWLLGVKEKEYGWHDRDFSL